MKMLFLASLALVIPASAIAQSSAGQLYERGVAARRAGNTVQAIELLTRSTAEQPENSDAHLQLGLALLAADRLDEAERAFRRTLALAPDYDDARIGLARVAQRRGDIDAALAEIEPVAPGYAEVDTLRRQLNRANDTPPKWHFDLDGSYSDLEQGREDWRELSVRLGRELDKSSAITVGVEAGERFGVTDIFGETKIDHRFSDATSGYLAIGGTPNADFRPLWQVALGGAHRIVAGPNPTLLTLDVRQSRYRVGDIQFLSPGIQQYLLGGKAWLTGRWINVFDENGVHLSGWSARGDVFATPKLRVFAGLADAPETSEGIVLDVFGIFAGLSYDLNDRTSLRVSLGHEDRSAGHGRNQLQAGVGFRF